MWQVRLIRDLCEFSPTYGKTRRRMDEFAFGHQAGIGYRRAAGVAVEQMDAPPTDEQLTVAEQLEAVGLGITTLLHTISEIETQLQRDANALLIIQYVQSEGGIYFRLTVPDALCWAYAAQHTNRVDGEHVVYVSATLGNHAELDRNPPTAYRVTPMGRPYRWAEGADGVVSTAIHLHRGKIEDGTLYARSQRVGDMNNLVTDYALGDLLAKTSTTETVAKNLIAFQRPDRKHEKIDPQTNTVINEFAQSVEVLRNLATSKGEKPSSLVAVEYAAGSNAPTVHALAINRDVDHQEFTRRSVQADICGALGWSPILNFSEQAATNLGGNLLYDTFEIVGMTTIEAVQSFHESIVSRLFNEVSQIGVPVGGYQLALPNRVTDFLDRVRAGATTRPDRANVQPDEPEELTDQNPLEA